MKLYLVRHGESEANVAGVINDDPAQSINLTPRGRRQAETAAERLRGELSSDVFTQAYASEFPRARQTAEILLAGLGLTLPLVVDTRLNERHSGLNGKPVEAFNGMVCPDPVNIKPADGESFREQMNRLRGFIDELARRHPHATVLAVSHENPIMAAAALSGRDPEDAARSGLGNCEWIILDWLS